MLCVERMRVGGFLPTISEYEPRCPSIVVELCSSSNQEVLDEDVPDCAHVRQSTVNRGIQCSSQKTPGNSGKDYDENSYGIGSTKVRSLKQDAEQIISAFEQRKTSNGTESDIRNKTISASWGTIPSTNYTQHEINDSQRDIRNTKVNTNSSALPRISNTPTQSFNNNDIRNKTIRAASHGDSNTVRNLKPSLAIPSGMSGRSLAASEPWRAVVMVRIGDQVRIWAKDSKNLVVEASPHEICKLDIEDDNETKHNAQSEGSQQQKATEHLITIPDQISLDSLIATLSLEGQLIIKEIRQQKPSRGNMVVIPIKKM